MKSDFSVAAKVITPCIASGCNNPSKGPRFKYLCKRHKQDATPEQVAKWQKYTTIDRKNGLKMKRAGS